MSIERTIWLLIVGFLLALFVVLIWVWRSDKNAREKAYGAMPIKQNPAYDAAAARESAREIFKGPDLQKMLEAIAFREEVDKDILRGEAEVRELKVRSQREATQLAILMGCAIVLGVAYGIYRFVDAP